MNPEDFLLDECEVLDDRRFDDWLGMLTPDCAYWAPFNWSADAPEGEVNLIYDDRLRLEDRVSRLVGGDAHSQDPASHTVRLLSQVREMPPQTWNPASSFSEVLGANFMLRETRRGEARTYAGRYTYWLRPAEDSWVIAAKKVRLQGSEDPLGNLTFLL